MHKTASMHGFILAIIANILLNVNTRKHSMHSVKSLTLQGMDIPEQLRSLFDAPTKLFYRGNPLPELLQHPLVAIVGSRKVDSYGTHVTKMLAVDLAQKGIVIVSGLALGVDAIAHSSAMQAGGASIGVLASGIEDPTPHTNSRIAINLLDKGGLLSEHPGDYAPHPHDFLIRNRLVSGLCSGVIITQAAVRSGSLNTASHALEQGKVVMAVPGPITNPLCEGPNNLLKMGATPVTCAEDVLKALGIYTEPSKEKDYDLLAENEAELTIITLIKEGVNDGELLAQRSGVSVQEFNVHMTMLEMRGVISPLGANHWTLS